MFDDEIQREQDYVTMLYAHVDQLRERIAQWLAALPPETGGTPQARMERDTALAWHRAQAAKLAAAENRLCFGRLDLRDGDRYYVGRIGLFDESADHEPLLLDWRAPAARPFYTATAAAPDGVRRRRHITTRSRTVVGLDDEVLDPDVLDRGVLDPDNIAERQGLTGQAALLASVTAGRTGRMRDIVATLQAEQDRIIRSDHRGILVVQGGPGTGKTAVALHRAAYLLYTHQRLAAHGVLIVGPNTTFLAYISRVLPDLGETSVLLARVSDLYPGVAADRTEPAGTAEIKGRTVMAEILAAAVRDRQTTPADPVEVEFEREVLRLDVDDCRQAVGRARASRSPRSTRTWNRRDPCGRPVSPRGGWAPRGPSSPRSWPPPRQGRRRAWTMACSRSSSRKTGGTNSAPRSAPCSRTPRSVRIST